MYPRLPVVLFDFDGTLADTIPLILASFHATLPTPATDAEIRSWIGRPLVVMMEDRHPGRGDELTAAYRQWNLANHDALIRPVPGIEGVLDDLHAAGVRTAVVSSKLGETVWLGLKAVGLDGHVDTVIGQEATSSHKPDPEPLLLAATRLGVPARECAYVGDATVDMIAAGAAGMTAIGVTWGAGEAADLVAAGANQVVDDPATLRLALGIA